MLATGKPTHALFPEGAFSVTFTELYSTTSSRDRAAVLGLVALLRERFPPPIHIIEVGAWAGHTTRDLAREGNIVWCVDNWCGNATGKCQGEALLKEVSDVMTPHGVLKVFAENLNGKFLRNVFPCFGSSDFWREIWPFPVHMVYIDADHSYPAVKKDLGWFEHVLSGGIMAGHDYYAFPGVRQAVNEIGYDGLDNEVWYKHKR